MAPTTKLLTKFIVTASINTNSGLASKSNAYQNPVYIDITNPENSLDFILDSNGKKTNIIVTYSNIEKHEISHLLKRATFQPPAKLPKSILLLGQFLNVKSLPKIAW